MQQLSQSRHILGLLLGFTGLTNAETHAEAPADRLTTLFGRKLLLLLVINLTAGGQERTELSEIDSAVAINVNGGPESVEVGIRDGTNLAGSDEDTELLLVEHTTVILVDAVELLLESLGGEHVVATLDLDGLSDTAGEAVGDALLLLLNLLHMPDVSSKRKDEDNEDDNTGDETSAGLSIGLIGRGVAEGINLGEGAIEILAGVARNADGVIREAGLRHRDRELSLGVGSILRGLVGSDPGIHGGLGELHVVNLGKRIVLVGEVVGEDVLLTGSTPLDLLLVNEVVGLNVSNIVVAARKVDASLRDGSGLASGGDESAGADSELDAAILLLSGGTETLGVEDEAVLAALAVTENVGGAGGDGEAAEFIRGRGEDEVGVLIVLGLVNSDVLKTATLVWA